MRIGVSSEGSSLNTLGLKPSGPAALEIFSARSSLKTPLSVMRISGMSFSSFLDRLVRNLQRAESFIGIC